MKLIKERVNGVMLTVPESMLKATPEQLKECCNGCGTGGWLALFVPDTIWGLSVSGVCDIHDWMYKFGAPHISGKELADRTFRDNLMRYIDAKTKWHWLKRLRMHRAKFYYRMVDDFGGPVYWAKKIPTQPALHVV